MNPFTSTLELLRVLDALLCLGVAVLNYWSARADARSLKAALHDDTLNGALAVAARDERQAEMFRIVVAWCFLWSGLILATNPPGIQSYAADTVQFLYVSALTGIGLSSVRARINRAVLLAHARANGAAT